MLAERDLRQELEFAELDLLTRLRPGDDPVGDLVARLLGRPAWHRLAVCRGMGPAMFFPTGKASASAEALAACARCAVRVECADAGRDEPYGYWAGVDATARRQGQRRPNPPPGTVRSCVECGELFEPRRPHARFCGEPCRVRWHNAKRGRSGPLGLT